MAIKHAATKSTGDTGLATEWNADHVFTSDYDCEQYEALNFVVENRGDYPAGPVTGQIIYRSDYNNFFGWTGTVWQSLTPVATIVVAADGTGHYTDIQDGIDALPADGGVVYIKEGTYNLTAKLDITIDNVGLIGAGRSTIIQSGANIDLLWVGGAGTKKGFVANKIYFKSTAVAPGYGIYSSEANGSITDCWFEGLGTGVYLDGGNDNIVTGNNFTSCSNEGVRVTILVGTGYRATVSDNNIYNCTRGIILERFNNCVAVGNLSRGNTTNGIGLISSAYNVLVGNICLDNGNDGINVNSNSDNNVVASAVCTGNTGHGIAIDNADCDKNLIHGNMLLGNTGGALDDNGTNTTDADNVKV